jgi:hypothetical protein
MSEYELNRSKNVLFAAVPTEMSELEANGNVYHFVVTPSDPSFLELFEVRSPLDKGSHSIWRSFEHYKSSCDVGSGGLSKAHVTTTPRRQNFVNADGYCGQSYTLYSGQFGAAGYLDDNLDPYYVPTAALTGFIPLPSNLEDLKQSALRAMLPRIKAELSLINSLIELKDFKSLGKTLKGLRSIPSLLLRKKVKIRNIYELLKVGADAYLQQKFNIGPLISDVQGVIRALAKVEKRINDLVARSGKMRVSHFSKPLSDTGLTSSLGVSKSLNNSGFLGTSLETRYVNVDTSTFHAQIEYNYHYSQFQLEHARVLALLDGLGVNFNPAIVWNAIPWTFVIDWVVNVSRWLNDQRLGNMEPKINIMQWLWSIKRRRRIYIDSLITCPIYYSGTGIPGNYTSTITHPVVTQTSYKRVAGMPSASSLITSGLNSTEFTLGAALVITRKRHRTARH